MDKKGVNKAELKKRCFISQKQEGYFAVRLKVVGGQVPSEHLHKISEIAEKYGKGYVHLTARQSIEIPFVKSEDIEAVEKEIQSAGLKLNFCGGGVRTITACQGSTVCKSGNIDTTQLAIDLDKRFGDRLLPHKFKIGMTGCFNNCLKAEENDLGIKGGVKPEWCADPCIFCKACEKKCPAKAIEVQKGKKNLVINEKKCINCGKCVKVCPKNAFQVEKGFVIYFGGLFGNKIAIGRRLFPIVFEVETFYNVVEITLNFFDKHGEKSERFSNTLKRVGWELLVQELEEVLPHIE